MSWKIKISLRDIEEQSFRFSANRAGYKVHVKQLAAANSALEPAEPDSYYRRRLMKAQAAVSLIAIP